MTEEQIEKRFQELEDRILNLESDKCYLERKIEDLESEIRELGWGVH
jgi:chromosome segregation ATPase